MTAIRNTEIVIVVLLWLLFITISVSGVQRPRGRICVTKSGKDDAVGRGHPTPFLFWACSQPAAQLI